MKTIDITSHGKPHPAKPSELYYVGFDHGKEVAEKVGFLASVQAGDVNLVFNEGKYLYRLRPSESFIRGLIGATAREIGIDEFVKRVLVNGKRLDLTVWGYDFWGSVCKYLLSEQKRLAKQAKEKARKEVGGVWSEPFRFFVPEIGTFIKLTEDWTFRLHYEYRNESLLNLFGKTFDWREYDKRGEKVGNVTLKAGTELSVNRVYIRQGAKEFSSITFYLNPKSEVTLEGKNCGHRAVSKGKVRFWAKLGDVNKMNVQIDTNTLAVN